MPRHHRERYSNWLRKHGLRTRRGERKAAGREARAAGRSVTLIECHRHGVTEFWIEPRGGYRCRACSS